MPNCTDAPRSWRSAAVQQNKLALAQDCMARGHFDEAITLYESAREGPFAAAPDVLLGLARARFHNGESKAARDLLEELAARHAAYYPQDVAILKARAADAAGDSETALRELAAMLDRAVGLEARFRYGEILARSGKTQEARTELKRRGQSRPPFPHRPDRTALGQAIAHAPGKPRLKAPTARGGRRGPAGSGCGCCVPG